MNWHVIRPRSDILNTTHTVNVTNILILSLQRQNLRWIWLQKLRKKNVTIIIVTYKSMCGFVCLRVWMLHLHHWTSFAVVKAHHQSTFSQSHIIYSGVKVRVYYVFYAHCSDTVFKKALWSLVLLYIFKEWMCNFYETWFVIAKANRFLYCNSIIDYVHLLALLTHWKPICVTLVLLLSSSFSHHLGLLE